MGRYETKWEQTEEFEKGVATADVLMRMLRKIEKDYQVIALCVVASDGSVHLPSAGERRCFVECVNTLFSPIPGRRTGSELRVFLSARQFAVDKRCEPMPGMQ